jgi:lysophospholipase L1-like esterase
MSYDRPIRLRMAFGISVLVAATCIGAAAAPDSAAPDAAVADAATASAAPLDAAAVQLIGRAEFSAGVWRVTWPGVAWRTAFSGPRVGITTQDSVGYGVTIDGIAMKPIPPSQTRLSTWYLGLTAGNHIIEVIRMRATPRSPGSFFGFSKGIDGTWLGLPPKPDRQIEFIADSGTSGYGDLSTTVDCAEGEVASRSDAGQSYAIVAAHQLHADWQLNAMDGIGVVRNWHGIWKGTNYATYAGLTLQSDPASRYHDSAWQPQVAVVRIGANDFGSPLATGEPWTAAQLETQFTDAYRKLLMGLREQLGPNGLIIVIQPALGDNPANQKVAAIVDSLRSAGDQRLYTLQFPPLELTGCDSHPNLSDHRLMGATLVKFIEEHGGPDLH